MEYQHIEVVDERTIRRTGDDYAAIKEAIVFALNTSGDVGFYTGIDEFPTMIRGRDFVKCFSELHRRDSMKHYSEWRQRLSFLLPSAVSVEPDYLP